MGRIVLSDMVKKLELETVYDGSVKEIDLPNNNFNRPGLQLAGFFDYYASLRVQVLGKVEMSYLESFGEEERMMRVEAYYRHGLPLLIVTRGMDIPECVVECAKKYDIPLYRTEHVTTDFIQHLVSYLDEYLMPMSTLHGVLMDIFGQGVLIMGQSGIGKSETALELIERGNRLVADDAVQVRRLRPERLEGRAPDLIKHFMEIRGVGVIDVKAMFGIGAVLDSKEIDILIKLEIWDNEKSYERLGLSSEYEDILGIKVPKITIPVRPGRNIAAVTETAARNERLKKMGYHAAQVLDDKVMKHNMKK